MFVLWMMVVSRGKGEEIVVNTTELCTLNLIATLAHNGKKCMQMQGEIGSRDVYRKKTISTI